jgi:hypothetical protein
MGIDQLIDETRSLKFAELADTVAKALDGELLDVLLLELMLVNEFEDESLLLVGALPPPAVERGMGALSGSLVGTAVIVGRDKPRGLDLRVHVGLQEFVEPAGLTRDVIGGHQFALD